MAGGEAGVRPAFDILASGVNRTMALLGVGCLEGLSSKHVTQLRRLGRTRSAASGPAGSTPRRAHRATARRQPERRPWRWCLDLWETWLPAYGLVNRSDSKLGPMNSEQSNQRCPSSAMRSPR